MIPPWNKSKRLDMKFKFWASVEAIALKLHLYKIACKASMKCYGIWKIQFGS